MDYQDKKIVCRDCQQTFIWTVGEQKFFAKKGFTHLPTRCPKCRLIFKQKKQNGALESKIVCSVCGVQDKVPIAPRHPEAVMCEECFNKFFETQKKRLND